jgi:hypothetical protein
LNALSNVLLAFGDEKTLVFVIVGKSMFGSRGDGNFVNCKNDRDKIFAQIKALRLRNVCFLCGDSHFSDVSQYVINPSTNQIIREIRNSSVSSIPRKQVNDNPWRVPGSLVDVNNFGLINVVGTYKNYTITYKDYTTSGVVYEYSWNQNY